MKTKPFYDPPRVETMNLHAEGVLCASVESTNSITIISENDYSDLEFESLSL